MLRLAIISVYLAFKTNRSIMLDKIKKIPLSFSQIINMNIGFFGIQYSFGLQQTAINPIYSFLGADPAELPLIR